MRFYSREAELDTLARIAERSEMNSSFTVVLGRRRIGKTALVLKSAEGRKHVYLFVNRVSEPVLCREFQRTMAAEGIDVLGEATKFGDLLDALMRYSSKEPLTVIIDEFQDFSYVNKSIFGDIQRVWDLRKDAAHINLIVSGSVHSLMVRIFEDSHQPLFGRATHKIQLRPFSIATLKTILADNAGRYSPEDLLMLYMLTGGVPSYVEALVDDGCLDAGSMLESALSEGSVFLRDGRDILVTELGKDHQTYFSIIRLISEGYTRRSQLEDILGMDVGAYLERLRTEYSVLDMRLPVLSEAKSRNQRWSIADMYLRFYFRFIHPNASLVEAKRYDMLQKTVRTGLAEYEGGALEDFFRTKIREEWEWTAVGGWWNRSGDIEVDIVVLNDLDGTARIIEVKRNPSKLNMGDLARKDAQLPKEFSKYRRELMGLSMEDM